MISIGGEQGSTILLGSSGNDTLRGGPENDILTGLGGNNFLNGGKGDDILTGGEGNDTLQGEPGKDILTGLGGNNFLDGGKGNDTITGGGIAFVNNQLVVTADTSGIDTMTGGKGADRFVLGGNPDPLSGSSATPVIHYDAAGNNDYTLITDFNSSQDAIALGGSNNDYRLDSSPSGLPTGTAIYLQNELIAIVQGSPNLSLSASYFQGAV